MFTSNAIEDLSKIGWLSDRTVCRGLFFLEEEVHLIGETD